MNDDTSPEVIERLRRFGQQPVDPSTAGRHLSEIAVASRGSAWSRSRLGRARLSLGIVIGFLAGSTGLAAADLLPDRAQKVAARALEAVGVDVPDPDDTVDETTDDVRDVTDEILDDAENEVDGLFDDDAEAADDDAADADAADDADGVVQRHQTDADGAPCTDDGTEVRNHGEYVSNGGDPNSRCGMPVQAGGPDGDDADEADEADDADEGDAGRGKPEHVPPAAGGQDAEGPGRSGNAGNQGDANRANPAGNGDGAGNADNGGGSRGKGRG